MNVSTTFVQQLMEIGYLAAGGGMTTEATTIFQGVEAVRPDSELPVIGHAVARLSAGRADEAITLLKSALEKTPGSEMAAAFLGLALKSAGMSQAAESLLQQVIASGKNAQAVDLAQSLLHPNG